MEVSAGIAEAYLDELTSASTEVWKHLNGLDTVPVTFMHVIGVLRLLHKEVACASS